MKRLMIFLICLLPFGSAAGADFDLLSADSSIAIDCQLYDSGGYAPVDAVSADSVTIDVYYVNGSSMVGDSIGYTTTASELSIINDALVFEEVFADIDGAGGDGLYVVTARFADASLGLSQTQTVYVTVGSYATVADIAAETADSAWDDGSAPTRILTALDEDNTTIDLDASNVGGLTGITFPTNFSDLAITITNGYVTAGTVNDKTDYRLSATGVDDVWDEAQSGHVTAGTFGARIDALMSSRSSHSAADVWAETEADSTLAMATRAAIAAYYPCDTSFVREYPLGSKPKVDSICVYCVCNGGVDTIRVANFRAFITNQSSSTTNVIDSLSSERK